MIKTFHTSYCLFFISSIFVFFFFLFQLDGATYHANVNIAGGGVGRNIAEGIWKIYGDVRLVSAVGTDQVSCTNLKVSHFTI